MRVVLEICLRFINQNMELFIQKVHQYADLDELTAYAAHDLIKAICIGAVESDAKVSTSAAILWASSLWMN